MQRSRRVKTIFINSRVDYKHINIYKTVQFLWNIEQRMYIAAKLTIQYIYTEKLLLSFLQEQI